MVNLCQKESKSCQFGMGTCVTGWRYDSMAGGCRKEK